MASPRRVLRAGVRFDCPDCGKLWRDDEEHAERLQDQCSHCAGVLRLVGVGEPLVQSARWYRCQNCGTLFMSRRGEIVETKPRMGFAEFA